MKKQLIILLPALLALAACGGTQTTSSSTPSKSSAATSAVSSTTSTSIVIPKITPVVTLTVSGITVSDENTLWIAGPVGTMPSAATASGEWAYGKATAGTSAGIYTFTFPEIEAGEIVTYKAYVDNATTFAWKNVCSECAGNTSLSLETAEGVNAYTQTVTFTGQPSASAVIASLDVIITPTDASGNALTLNAGVYVWMWDSLDNGAVVLTDNGDGTWHKTLTNVPYGTDALGVTPFLAASATTISWDYPSDTYTTNGYKFTLASTDTQAKLTAAWSKQPAAVDTTKPSVTINLTCNAFASGDAIPKLVWGTAWNAMTATTTTNAYTYTVTSLDAGDYSFYFYHWGTTDEKMYADASKTLFSVTVATTSLTLNYTGDFSTGIGALNS